MIRSLTDSPTVCIEETSSKRSLQDKPAVEYSDCSSPHTTSLPLDFKPASYTVIVGRGREPKENIGNKRLRVLAANCLPKYSNATDKRTKTRIVSSLVSMVRDAPGGAFVKHGKDGRWYEVNDAVAREKVGYTFRDLLSDRYRSSSKSKVARRRIQEQRAAGRASVQMERAMRLPCSVEKIFFNQISLLGDVAMEPLDIFQPVNNKLEDDDFDLQDLLTAPLLLF
jgi:hypothetical protein